MIETGITLLRLLLGLGAIFFLGYALLTLLVPRPRDFSCLERAAFSFGVGALALTLWMLALTWGGVPFGLAWILGPPLALAAALLLAPRGRRAVREDRRALRVRPRMALSGWDWLFLGLLGLVFLYALPRAALYPMWAWDAVATWGCKARIFYDTKGLDLICIDAHNYYPNLIPLLLSYLYFALGQVNDYLVNAIFPLWGALLLGLLYSLSTRLGLSRRCGPGPDGVSGPERHRLHRPPVHRLRRPAPGLLYPGRRSSALPLAGRRRPPGQPDPGGLLSGGHGLVQV